jgi:hypothetical protein
MALAIAGLAGCGAVGTIFPEFEVQPAGGARSEAGAMGMTPETMAASGPRRTIMPEMLVACRGHVVVPALGMMLVPNGGVPLINGQYMREERLTAPYRIVRPGDRVTTERNPTRLNVEVDRVGRIFDLNCG